MRVLTRDSRVVSSRVALPIPFPDVARYAPSTIRSHRPPTERERRREPQRGDDEQPRSPSRPLHPRRNHDGVKSRRHHRCGVFFWSSRTTPRRSRGERTPRVHPFCPCFSTLLNAMHGPMFTRAPRGGTSWTVMRVCAVRSVGEDGVRWWRPVFCFKTLLRVLVWWGSEQ